MQLVSTQYLLEKLSPYDKDNMLTELVNNFSTEQHVEIIANKIKAIPLVYSTKKPADCLWEAHRKFVDVHIMIDQSEIVFVSDIEDMQPSNDYNDKDDYQLFDGKVQHRMHLHKGMCLVLQPEDVHKTAVQFEVPNELKKIVVKIEKELAQDVFEQ